MTYGPLKLKLSFHGRLIFSYTITVAIIIMWRSHFCQAISMAVRRRPTLLPPPLTAAARFLTSSSSSNDNDDKKQKEKLLEGPAMSLEEVKKLMRLVNVEGLKRKLVEEGKEVIGYGELLKACQSVGVVRSVDDAKVFANVLDEAGVVLLFRDRVYLHPHKVVELVTSSVPLDLLPEDDPCREELKRLQELKEEIDRKAHEQVRLILWFGLGVSVLQVGLFFRLTFWEFSWDVMEPVAFFTTATSLVICYGYFMITSKEPTYRDLMKTIFLSRQRKLLKKYDFDVSRFKELRDKCQCPTDKKHVHYKNEVLEDA